MPTSRWRAALCADSAAAENYFPVMSNPVFPVRLQGVDNPIHAEDAMKYLCLIYDDEQKFATISKSEMDTMYKEYGAFSESIKASGNYIAGHQLQPTRTASTVRVRNGQLSTTDGPFAETKEQLGGFYLIEAGDLNEAIQIAGKIPSARNGSIEVRPLVQAPAQAAG
jgi:hypothetical protein